MLCAVLCGAVVAGFMLLVATPNTATLGPEVPESRDSADEDRDARPMTPSIPRREGYGRGTVDATAGDGDVDSQPARLRGRIYVYGRRETISNARIVFEGLDAPIEADADGTFSVDLPPGTYEGRVRAPGFLDLPTRVALKSRQDLELEYFLEEDLDDPRYRTIVYDDRQRALSSTTLRGEEMRRVPGTFGDPLRTINSMPGVSQLAGFLPYVVVRGAAPGNTGYYLDGVRVPLLFHVAIGPSVIHPYFLESLDFYPSGAPVRLGRFSSGIIEAHTRAVYPERVRGEVEVRLTDAGMLLNVPISRPVVGDCEGKRSKCKKGDPRGSLTFGGRYSYTAGILSLVQSEARIAFWDYQARFDHRLPRGLEYTAFAYGAYDDLGTKATANEPAQTFLRFSFHRFDQRVRQRLARGGQATYAVALGLDGTSSGNLRSREYRVAPRIHVVLPTKRQGIDVGFGIDQEFQVFRLDERNGEAGNDLDDLGSLTAIFGDRFVSATSLFFDVPIVKGIIEARPGVRMDIYAQQGASPYLPRANAVSRAVGVDPRLSLREHVAERWTLRQSVGIFHQPPSLPIPLPSLEAFGFERGLQRNTQASFGYEFRFLQDKLQLEQEVYVGYLSNLQDYRLAADSEDNPINDIEDVLTRVSGWTYGLETMIRLDPRMRFFGWVAYTLSRATRNFNVGGSAPANWDQRHIINVVLGYKVSKRWNIGSRVHYHTGRPWTSPEAGQSVADAFRDNRNNARLPPFFQLDLRVDRIWVWPRWQLQAYLELVNATYSNEVFDCDISGVEGNDFRAMQRFATAAAFNPSRGVARCSPVGFRYTIPMLGMQGRW